MKEIKWQDFNRKILNIFNVQIIKILMEFFLFEMLEMKPDRYNCNLYINNICKNGSNIYYRRHVTVIYIIVALKINLMKRFLALKPAFYNE